MIDDPALAVAAPGPGPRHARRRDPRASLDERPGLGLAEAADRRRRWPSAVAGARLPGHRHAARDEARLPDRRASAGTRRWPRRSSASSTSTATGATASRPARTALLAGTPGTGERPGGRRSAGASPTRPRCSRSRSTASDLRLTTRRRCPAPARAARCGATFSRNHAVGATGLIMNAETGAILAMASYPVVRRAIDSPRPTASCFANPAIARQYEPGSVMKAFTVAAALDAGAITTARHLRRRQQSPRRAPSGSRTPIAADHP